MADPFTIQRRLINTADNDVHQALAATRHLRETLAKYVANGPTDPRSQYLDEKISAAIDSLFDVAEQVRHEQNDRKRHRTD